MNEGALQLAYANAISQGYKGDINTFRNLLTTNKNALNLAYQDALNKGYNGDFNNFQNLLLGNKSIQQQPVTSKTSVKQEETNFDIQALNDKESNDFKPLHQENENVMTVMDPFTVKWYIFKNKYEFIYTPILLILFLLILAKIIKIGFINKTTRITFGSIKDFFITINSQVLDVRNVHKRLIQFISVLLFYVVFKRNYFEQPLLLYAHIFTFCLIWILYYCFETYGKGILYYIIKFERQILFFILINIINIVYKIISNSASFEELYITGVLPFIIYLIIFLFNQKSVFNFPLYEKVSKLNLRTNFYIQQNLYFNYLLGLSYYYGNHKFNTILYFIVFSWVVLFLYVKLILTANNQVNTEDFINKMDEMQALDISKRKKTIVVILILLLIFSLMLYFINLFNL